MKIWITGIAGFLGGHLAQALHADGHKIRGNDNLLCADNYFLNTLPEFTSPADIFHLKDCRDFSLMKECLTPSANDPHDKFEVLIHCAATAHEGLSNFSPSFITKNIYEASVTTFSAAIAAGVKRIIFMSSMARYGNGGRNDDPTLNGPPFFECDDANPIDPYGIAKVASEDTLKVLCRLHNVEYVIAVPHNIIGIRQKYDDPFRNVASIMINRALHNKPILIYGDGKQKRCFSPIKDCLPSLIKMIDAPINGEIINIGPDKGEITVLELAEIVRDLTGGMAEIQHVSARPNEVKEAYCSSDKARKLLGYEPKQSLRDCLSEMVDYIKEKNRIHGVKPFEYKFPIEIEKGCPAVWTKQML